MFTIPEPVMFAVPPVTSTPAGDAFTALFPDPTPTSRDPFNATVPFFLSDSDDAPA